MVPSPSLWGGGGTPGALETKVGDGVMATEPGAPLSPSPALPSSSLISERLYLNLFCAPRDLNSEGPRRGGFHGSDNCRLPRGESALPWQPHLHLPKVLGRMVEGEGRRGRVGGAVGDQEARSGGPLPCLVPLHPSLP